LVYLGIGGRIILKGTLGKFVRSLAEFILSDYGVESWVFVKTVIYF